MTAAGVDTEERLIVGLMSGSSLDGIDAALVSVRGCCDTAVVELRHSICLDFDTETRDNMLALFDYQSATVDKLCVMHAVLGECFADAVFDVAASSGMPLEDIDLVGAWPVMMYHLPGRSNPFTWREKALGACLQLGDLNRIAERTGITTVGSFCARDIAAGGNGAPLTGLGDYILYRDREKNRVVQNIGGIANANLVPADGGLESIIGFDTGPGNMVIDGLVRHYSGGQDQYDRDGQIAARGQVNSVILETLLQDPFMALSPPKAAGRENYGERFLRNLIQMVEASGISSDDAIATATAFTAESIALSYRRFFEPSHRIDEVIVGGGGARNPTLMRMLQERVSSRVRTDDDFGIPSFIKEAMYMALLANETTRGHANNAPSVTGAREGVVMGAIYPGRGANKHDN